MTIGFLSGMVTAVLLAVFLGGVAWAWSGRRNAEFNLAARIPLDDDIEANPGDRL